MMMRKFLSQRFSKMATQGRISSSSLARIPKDDSGEAKTDSDPGDLAVSRRFLHKIFIGESLIEKLRGMGVNKDRIRLDGLSPPPMKSAAEEETLKLSLTVQDTKKLLRAVQIEVVKSKLLETGKIWIHYSDFVKICNDSSLDRDQGHSIAKILDDSGNVIVLGNSVCLKPNQVTKSIQGLLPLPRIYNQNDPRRKELKELEAIKTIIDDKANSLVRRELWAGLSYLIIQTTGFMRLTFWELTWDVMEPICFYVTSLYFMVGYAFFLRTSREPSFEGFYQSRFEAKQKKLMESDKFDVVRYNELKKLLNPKPSVSVSKILGTLRN